MVALQDYGKIFTKHLRLSPPRLATSQVWKQDSWLQVLIVQKNLETAKIFLESTCSTFWFVYLSRTYEIKQAPVHARKNDISA